ncbi:PIN domain-containing protein [uncultured Arcticibacterium sp.]|uniref:type II toxin-antitoxin system VapC family toxin n=1 Tax=uncultured Arcticibacterium sp. TaxID=2173042 RepID=UPI0030F5A082
MNIFIDTNVILDVFHLRHPFYDASSELLGKCEKGELTGFMNLISLANIHYISSKIVGKEQSISNLKVLLGFMKITSSNSDLAKQALYSDFNDLEDALQHYSAAGVDKIAGIITRDLNDFKVSDIPVYTPSEFLKLNP